MLAPYLRYSSGFLKALYHGARCDNVALQGGVAYRFGQCLGQFTGSGSDVNERQTITVTGTPTGGTVTLVYGTQFVVTFPYNATGQQVVDAINAAVGFTVVSLVSGGPLPGTAVVVEFINEAAKMSHVLFTATAAFTGGSTPAVAVTRTQVGKPAGGYYAAYNDALSDGTQVMRRLLKYDTVVGITGLVTRGQSFDFSLGAGQSRSIPAYFHGVFRCSDLVGLDANGVADVGRLINGSAYTDANAVLAMSGGG